MNSRKELNAVRLLIGADRIVAEMGRVPPEYADQVESARAEVVLMRGTAVLTAVLACIRSGLPLALDLRPTTVRTTDEKSSRPGRR